MINVKINGIDYVPKQTCGSMTPASLGDVLKALRIGTLDEVAREAGVSKTYLWKIENGKAESPSFAIIVRLARHYGISLDELAKAVDLSRNT